MGASVSTSMSATVRVVHVLVAGKAREDRLAQEAGKAMPSVPAGARIGDQLRPHVNQSESIVEFAMEQHATVATDGGALERELDGPVELKPTRAEFRFTHQVRRQILAPPSLTHCEL